MSSFSAKGRIPQVFGMCPFGFVRSYKIYEVLKIFLEKSITFLNFIQILSVFKFRWNSQGLKFSFYDEPLVFWKYSPENV